MKAIPSTIFNSMHDIIDRSEALELRTEVSHRIQSDRYGISNLLARNYFAVINDSLKDIPKQA
jgi:hypothetical protein